MARRVFVNREKLRAEFPQRYSTYMKKRNENKTADILYYQGTGGIGKSTLLEEFEKKIATTGCIIKKFDFDIEDIKNPISFLIAVRQSFADDIEFPLFDYAYYAYVKKANIESDSRMKEIKAFSEILECGLAILQADVIEVFKKICNIYKCFDQVHKRRSYDSDVDDIRCSTAKEIEHNLVKYLARDIENGINYIMPDVGVVIFLDTFEQVTSYQNDCIGNELKNLILNERYGLISNTPRVLYVIASREPCEFGCLRDIPYEDKNNSLDIWDECDAVKFIMENSSIEDENFCKQLAQRCGYYPFYLNIALDHIEHNLCGDYTKMTLDELNLEEMLEMFLRGLNDDYRNTIALLSCQNDWDDAIFREVTSKINFSTVSLDIIRQYSFIKEVPHSKGKITVHQIMRECIEKYSDKNLYNIQKEIHEILKDIYDHKSYDIKQIVQYSNGEKNLLNQYTYHSIWLIRNFVTNELRFEQFDALLSEFQKLREDLTDSGAAKILLSPLEQLAECAVELYGEDCPSSIECHYQMAFAHTYSGNLEMAEKEDTYVYNSNKRNLDRKLRECGISLQDLHILRELEDNMVKSYGSMIYDMCRNGKYPIAVVEGQKCLGYASSIWGENDLNTLPIKSNLSYYKLKNNDVDGGIELAEDVLLQRETLNQKLTRLVLLSKRNLAVQYSRKDLKHALKLIEESYNGYRNSLGRESAFTLESRQYFANFLIRDKRYRIAISHLNEILPIRIKIDGEKHPNVIDCLTYLSFAYLGEYQESYVNAQLYDCAKENIQKAYDLAKVVFSDNTSKWKIEMYGKVYDKVFNNENVEDIVATLDNYTP